MKMLKFANADDNDNDDKDDANDWVTTLALLETVRPAYKNVNTEKFWNNGFKNLPLGHP